MSKDLTDRPVRPTSAARTIALTVTFSVDARADEHLQSDEAINSEISSWLESLDATVHALELTEPTSKPGPGG